MKPPISVFFGFLLLACVSVIAQPATAAIFVQNIAPAGCQAWSGPLGDDFTVGSYDIVVSKLGVYDGAPAGLGRTITAYIYDSAGAVVVPATLFTTGNSVADPVVPYRWITLATPVTLSAGVTYSVVAENYGSGELNPNTNITTPPITFSSDGLSVGRGRYSSTKGTYPTITGPWHFGAGNFDYRQTPEPATLIIWSLLGVLAITVGWLRRRVA